MSNISFTNGSSMTVQKLYQVKKECLESVNKAIINPEDNSDYVIFQKGDNFLVASGKGDLEGHDKDIKLGIADKIKFSFGNEQLIATKVVDKPNTSKAFNKEHFSEHLNPGISLGLPAMGAFVGMMIGSAIGDEFGAKIGAGVGAGIGAAIVSGSYYHHKHSFTTIKSPDINHLASQGVLKEVK